MCQQQICRLKALVIICWKPQINAARKIIALLFQRLQTNAERKVLITHTKHMVACRPVWRFASSEALHLIMDEFLSLLCYPVKLLYNYIYSLTKFLLSPLLSPHTDTQWSNCILRSLTKLSIWLSQKHIIYQGFLLLLFWGHSLSIDYIKVMKKTGENAACGNEMKSLTHILAGRPSLLLSPLFFFLTLSLSSLCYPGSCFAE